MPVDDDAVAAFVRWASLQAGAPRDVAPLVLGVERSDEYVGLLSTDVQGRRVVWKTVAFAGKGRVTFTSVTIETVDAWSVEAGPLRQRSDHIASCDACRGEGKIRCAACGGAGTTTCTACHGLRKRYGYAANGSRRLLNCTTCRGKGELDCEHCRRGIAVCRTCDGNGRVQRWIELETWRRSLAAAHPPSIPLRFGWDANPPSDVVAREAEIVADVEKPRRLAADDLGKVPADWLAQLSPALQPGERVARQRLRIASIPTQTIRYRLGGDEDRIALAGRHLVGPPADWPSAFTRRAAALRRLRIGLAAAGVVLAILSLARGPFFWSIPTTLSLAAFTAALVAVYGGAADWTATRRQTRRWLIAAASGAVLAIALAAAALPRLSHAERLTREGNLDAAEEELRALGSGPGPWADLHLARIRQASAISDARRELEQIPADLPQRAEAELAVDRLILLHARDNARRQGWAEAVAKLALLSDRARGEAETLAVAAAACLPLARQKIAEGDWSGAADAIVAARRLGVAAADLDALTDPIRAAGSSAAAAAAREGNAARRLQRRIEAEKILVSWERASENWDTPLLTALRTSMARDLAAAEKAARRRRSL